MKRLANALAGRTGPRRAVFAGCATLGALGAVTFSVLRQTNFRGYDEWLIFWMLSHGLVSFPHANRPLGLVWHLPAWWIAPDRLWGFVLVHAAWLTVVGVLTFLVVRRLSRGDVRLALLAGAFAVAWMPSETTRIVTVQMIQYSGCAAGVLLATWLLVEAWHRQSRWLLAAAALAAAVAALSLEAALPQLASAPFLLLLAESGSDRPSARRRWWIAGALAFALALGARAALPLLAAPQAVSYQLGVLGSPRPAPAVVRQIGVQLWYHLAPAFETRPAGLVGARVALAVIVFVLGLAWVARHAAASERRIAALAAVLGLAHAVLGYLPFVLSRAVRGPVRTEFLSAAGIGLFVASGITLVASLAPRRARLAAAAVLGAWVVAAGTGRTVALQREWSDALYAAQRRTLEQIAAIAPRLKPRTLVVLLQSGHTWSFDFSFSKAIEYLYADAARGWVPRADPLLLETRVEPGGVVSAPAPVLRAAWGEPIVTYRPDETVVFTEDEGGRLRLLDEWPEDLGPLPPGPRYAPRTRIPVDAPPPARLSLLRAAR